MRGAGRRTAQNRGAALERDTTDLGTRKRSVAWRLGVLVGLIGAVLAFDWTNTLSLAGGALLIGFGLMWPALWLATLVRPRSDRAHTGESADAASNTPRFSIIVPARNESAVIGGMVTQIRTQTYVDWQLLVIANNCSDDTAQVARAAAGADPRVRVVEAEFPSGVKADALNLGLSSASGDVVVELDADNSVTATFLAELAQAFGDPSTVAVQTAIRAQNTADGFLPLMQDVEFCIYSEVYNRGRRSLGLSSSIGGTGFAIRATVLRDMGGWSRHLVEDFELHMRLARAGVPVEYLGGTVVHDEKPADWRALVRQRRRWVRGHLGLALSPGSGAGLSLLDRIYLWSPAMVALSLTLLLLGYAAGLLPALVGPFAYYSPLFWLTSLGLTGTMAWAVTRSDGRDYSLSTVLAYVAVFSFHWVVVLLAALWPVSWASTKTDHGVRPHSGRWARIGVNGAGSGSILLAVTVLAALWLVPLAQSSVGLGLPARELLQPVQMPVNSELSVTSVVQVAEAAARSRVSGGVYLASGAGVRGATITLSGRKLPTYRKKIGRSGSFSLAVKPGTYTVAVSKKGYATARKRVRFRAGTSTQLKVVLKKRRSTIGIVIPAPY